MTKVSKNSRILRFFYYYYSGKPMIYLKWKEIDLNCV